MVPLGKELEQRPEGRVCLVYVNNSDEVSVAQVEGTGRRKGSQR